MLNRIIKWLKKNKIKISYQAEWDTQQYRGREMAKKYLKYGSRKNGYRRN